MTSLDLARHYAARGWHVFPCVVNEKVPATRSGFKAATLAEPQLRTWWGKTPYNIGIWTGQSALVVMDLDLKVPVKRWRGDEFEHYRFVQDHDQPVVSGYATWLDVLAEHGEDWIETYTVITPSCGVHLYFSYEGDDIHPAVNWRKAIDVRSMGSYVLAAGSSTEVGTYEVDDQMPSSPVPLPSWLAEMLRKETHSSSGLPPPEGDNSTYARIARKAITPPSS